MTGGLGQSDTFVISADTLGGTINDIITDFEGGAGGDTLDLTSLLNGLAGVSDLAGYVKVEQGTGGDAANSFVSVDTTGGGDSYQVVAVLQSFTYSSETVKVLFEESPGVKHTDTV